MKTKRVSRKTWEDSRKRRVFGCSDLNAACSEPENDLRPEMPSYDSGTDGPPCCQWRKGRRAIGIFTPALTPQTHKNFLPQDNNKTCTILLLQKGSSDLQKQTLAGGDLAFSDPLDRPLAWKNPSLILLSGGGLTTIPPDWRAERCADT